MLLLLGSPALFDQIPLVEGAPGAYPPQVPSIVSIGQASGMVVVGVVPNALTGAYPVAFLNLYRSTTASGPWNYVSSTPPSSIARENFLLDTAPIFGARYYYAASAIDASGNESDLTPSLFFNAIASPTFGTANISAGAFGPYPWLGTDVFLSPATGEAVPGPNGDLLTVSGLECLAQDLRIRLTTRPGELLLSPNFGFRSRIGSGQARPTVQAQIFAADVQDCISADPRVTQVLNVEVAQYDGTGWVVGYTAMAIGAEDPLRANIVYPYYLQAA